MSAAPLPTPPPIVRRESGGWVYHRLPSRREEDTYRGTQDRGRLVLVLGAALVILIECGTVWCFTGWFMPMRGDSLLALALVAHVWRIDRAREVILGRGWIGFRVRGILPETAWGRLSEIERLEIREINVDPWEDYGEAELSLRVVMRAGLNMEIEWFGDWQRLHAVAAQIVGECPKFEGGPCPS